MAVDQWKREFMKWSVIDPDLIVCFTANGKKTWDSKKSIILITTYHMIAYSGKSRSKLGMDVMEMIQKEEVSLTSLTHRSFAHSLTHSFSGVSLYLTRCT